MNFNHKEYGSLIGSGTYKFRHYGSEVPPVVTGPLCFTATVDGSEVLVNRTNWSGGQFTLNRDFKYSTNGTTWNTFTPGTTVVRLENAGDKVYFKGNNPTGFNEGMQYYSFGFTHGISISGNIMSLIDDGACTCLTIPSVDCFERLFYSSAITGVYVDASGLLLPATNLTNDCYGEMFCNCYGLRYAPSVLPATTLVQDCYNAMFSDCKKLLSVPKLMSNTLALRCYQSMFSGCLELQVSDTQTAEAPYAWTIPASGTFNNTYSQNSMFYNCAGTRSSNTMPGQQGQSYTYYTQNNPV